MPRTETQPEASKNETRFTKGPWKMRLSRWSHNPPSPVVGFVVYSDAKKAPDGGIVELTSANYAPQWATSAFYTPEEMEANAHLLAASPDLYAALGPALDLLVLKCGNLDPCANQVIADARAALARAGGEAVS